MSNEKQYLMKEEEVNYIKEGLTKQLWHYDPLLFNEAHGGLQICVQWDTIILITKTGENTLKINAHTYSKPLLCMSIMCYLMDLGYAVEIGADFTINKEMEFISLTYIKNDSKNWN